MIKTEYKEGKFIKAVREALHPANGEDTTAVVEDGEGTLWLWGNSVEHEELDSVRELLSFGLIVRDGEEDGFRTYRVTEAGRDSGLN